MEPKRGSRGRVRRGVALLTVMLLVIVLSSLALSFFLRGRYSLFAINRDIHSTVAFFVAENACRDKTMQFLQLYRASGDPREALKQVSAGVNRDYPVTDARGQVVGYADISFRIDDPHEADPDQTFEGLSYMTVTVRTTGSTRLAGTMGRVERTVEDTYNVGLPGLPNDALNFAYFMNHWAWFGGFVPGQAQMSGNVAANGNFDVISDSLTVYPGGSYLHSPTGRRHSSALYAMLNLRAYPNPKFPDFGRVEGIDLSQVSQQFGRVPVPTDLTSIADENGSYVRRARRYNNGVGGSVDILTARVTGTNPLSYEVSSTRKVVQGGVYGSSGGGQKENLVLAGTPTTDGNGDRVTFTIGQSLQIVKITGPVVVKGNVVLQGLVTGRGTVYAGRNFYIAGDVSYANPPSTYPRQNARSAGTPREPQPEDFSRDQLIWCAAGNIVEGDVTNRNQWWTNSIQPWIEYRDPATGQVVNDNHEDTGVDGVVDSLDNKENDGSWTVLIRNKGTGEVKATDLPVTGGRTQVPTGWEVISGTGEDTDGNGRYTPAYRYDRDFAFASRVDADGHWSAQSFSPAHFDNWPGTTADYRSFCKPIKRIDGFLMASGAVAGVNGNMQWNSVDWTTQADNVVNFGGECARQDAVISYLDTGRLQMYHDARYATAMDLEGPIGTRVQHLRWQER